MAEAVVGLLVGKLGAALLKEAANSSASLLCHEVSALKGLFGQIRGAKDELESMQAYLNEAEWFKDTDKTTGLFVQRIRGFAFEIEDVVDEFTYKLEDKHGGFAARTKKRIKHAKSWRRLAHKLQDINGRLQAAKQLNQQYAVPQMDRNAGGSAFHANQALNFTRDEDLVGITENKELLTQWLASDLKQRCKITTVWGMPGVGKTTLVAHVYKTIKLDFDVAAWVTVSQSFDVQELLRKIAREFGIKADMANMEMGSVAETIYSYLQGKRYILVLDDVWTTDVWSEIRKVIPSNCIGRFIITSRNQEVSLLGTNNYAIHLEPLQKDKSWELLTQWLALEQRCKIATVWGMPGVGKTTLVAHVYKTIKLYFDAAAWVTVSQSYDVQELLRKIARELGIQVDVANMEMGRLAAAINEFLQGKRYILVLDDVWTVDVWSKLRTVFPSNNCIGRFVITSRNHEVSLLRTSNYAIHLEPLKKDKSWELFCKSAFRDGGDRKCPPHLEELALKFVEKCEGLPIAIACVGSLLSGRGQTYVEWKKAYAGLELQLVKHEMRRVETIVKVSLEDLPYDLRNCFLHCALFPEDYIIKRRIVMRQWIASGFIKKKGNQTLEDVAEEFLIELVNRSLLQVVERNDFGRLKCCRMHDVIRLVALNKAEEECFGKVYYGTGEFSVGHTRRISIMSGKLDQISPIDASHIRSLHAFDRYINIDLLRPILASSNLLSTLDLQGAYINVLPSEVFNLFNLRYLGLRYTAIESLPETIGRLQNLEVLDAVNAKLSYLPNNIVKLKKLRYLYACYVFQGNEIEPKSGVRVPSGIRHLTSLQALQYVEASSEILHEVGDLTELRTFGVCNVRSKHSGDLRNAINKMNHLVHLTIAALGEGEVLQLEGLHLPPTISNLELAGQLAKTSMPQVLSSWSHLSNLSRLLISFSNVDDESFSYVLVLRGLCSLELIKAFDGKKLHFTTGCFPKLRHLSIWHAPQLNQVQIEEGAMPSLARLGLRACRELKCLPQGIEHLTNLEVLILLETLEELRELWQKGEPNEDKDDLMSIRHIRKVIW